ncbi:hypothetical protein TRIP_D440110 [uncultured Paludibacter sp.]|nr:hypothetical protein TRIP_D440110 [uncultured Paludibacter sp.]
MFKSKINKNFYENSFNILIKLMEKNEFVVSLQYQHSLQKNWI